MNPVAENILGLDSSALGKSILEVFPYRYANLFRQLEELEDLIKQNEEVIQGEDTIIAPNGKTLFINYTINLIRENGKLKGYIVTLRDITRQKEIEQERNDMIALLSHDIRNPLTAVSGYISLLLKRGKDLSEEDKKRFILMAKRELDRMTRMLNNLIDLVKLETGGLKISITDINLTEIIKYYVETYNFISAMHDFKAEVPDEEIWVRADKEVLQQILDNLLSNAVKYSPSGGTITVGAKLDKEKNEVIVFVRDQGLGIPEDQLKNLFRKYFRVETKNRKGIRGTGLGLYITKKLIEQMGGTIWVESKEGKGSIFFFTLKLSEKPDDEEEKEKIAKGG
jgi:two-component system sensor histidine kinase VicK